MAEKVMRDLPQVRGEETLGAEADRSNLRQRELMASVCCELVHVATAIRSSGPWMVSHVSQKTTRDSEREFLSQALEGAGPASQGHTRKAWPGAARARRDLGTCCSGPRVGGFGVPGLGLDSPVHAKKGLVAPRGAFPRGAQGGGGEGGWSRLSGSLPRDSGSYCVLARGAECQLKAPRCQGSRSFRKRLALCFLFYMLNNTSLGILTDSSGVLEGQSLAPGVEAGPQLC